MSCEYTEVSTNPGIGIQGCNRSTWKPLLRQSIISLGVAALYFLLGVYVGAPTVVVAQLRRSDTNSTEIITDTMLSWLSSTISISSLPFVIVLPVLFDQIGRKLTFLFVWVVLLIGFIIFYYSTSIYYLLISEIFAGVSSASLVTITPILVAEYTSPEYRGIFLTLKSASIFWGIWVSNAIGTFYPWKNIALLSFLCSAYLITLFIWPESPHWLAMKGRYAECAKSHRWLKGVNENSEKELVQLISNQKEIHNGSSPLRSDMNNFCVLIRSGWLAMTSRTFYKPVLISLMLFAQYCFIGKLIITMYAIEVLKHLTKDESFVYKEMLILDGFTVLSMYVGCILSRYCKRRVMLLLFSGSGIALLYTLSLYTYLVSLSIFIENQYIVLALLSTFSLAVGCGPMILSTSIYGELIPTRYKKPAMITIGLGATAFTSILLKLSPFMFKNLKMHGCFLFYGTTSAVCLIILYIYLPETKDKTIQEIEAYFTDTHKIDEPENLYPNHRETGPGFDSRLGQTFL